MFEKRKQQVIERHEDAFYSGIPSELYGIIHFFDGLGIASSGRYTPAVPLPVELMFGDGRLAAELETEFNQIVEKDNLTDEAIRSALEITNNPLFNPRKYHQELNRRSMELEKQPESQIK